MVGTTFYYLKVLKEFIPAHFLGKPFVEMCFLSSSEKWIENQNYVQLLKLKVEGKLNYIFCNESYKSQSDISFSTSCTIVQKKKFTAASLPFYTVDI